MYHNTQLRLYEVKVAHNMFFSKSTEVSHKFQKLNRIVIFIFKSCIFFFHIIDNY